MDLGEVEGLRAELAGFVEQAFASVPRRDQRGWGIRIGRRCSSS